MTNSDASGYLKLGFAIVEQAAMDVQKLTSLGIIKKGKCITPWPTRRTASGEVKPQDFLDGYNSRMKVNLLLEFFQRGDVKKLLCMMNSEMKAKKLLAKLDLV